MRCPSAGGLAATASTAFTTRSAGMMSRTESGSPEKSWSTPLPKARMIGSAIRNPSSQPGKGSLRALSMIEGRTIESGMSPCSSTTACSASAFVKE